MDYESVNLPEIILKKKMKKALVHKQFVGCTKQLPNIICICDFCCWEPERNVSIYCTKTEIKAKLSSYPRDFIFFLYCYWRCAVTEQYKNSIQKYEMRYIQKKKLLPLIGLGCRSCLEYEKGQSCLYVLYSPY